MSSCSWDEIFRSGGYPLDKPYPALISLYIIFEQRGINRICDLGCGTGRNLLFLAGKGFELHRVDISAEGLRQTRHKLDDAGLEAELVKSDMVQIPYKSSSFDAVICIYAIYHNRLEGIVKTLAEIYRILIEGGVTFITFQSLRSHKYGRGIWVEKNTFIQDFPFEQGIPHHFSDREEVCQLMKAFRIIKLELFELKSQDGKTYSHWEVFAEKE
ncbi:MAG: class I SAM-dependent methyltransferase [Thermoproteota archaeon]